VGACDEVDAHPVRLLWVSRLGLFSPLLRDWRGVHVVLCDSPMTTHRPLTSLSIGHHWRFRTRIASHRLANATTAAGGKPLSMFQHTAVPRDVLYLTEQILWIACDHPRTRVLAAHGLATNLKLFGNSWLRLDPGSRVTAVDC